jgi:hypothetical protein
MLGPLKDEIPAQMGKANERLTTSGMRPSLSMQWRSAIGAREQLSVQRRIPFSGNGHTKPNQKTPRNLEGSEGYASFRAILKRSKA